MRLRPRIEKREAEFILELLEKEKAAVETQEQQLLEKIKPLGVTVSKAMWYRRNYMTLTAIKECDYPKCVDNLTALQTEDRVLLRRIYVFKKLLKRYTLMAQGKKSGRAPRDAQEVSRTIYHMEQQNKSNLGVIIHD